MRERFPLSEEAAAKHPSLGIPTWLYGHEPPNAFATAIAKYFANSVREDGLLAIAKAGVIYSPGSAGTIQEIFQDACQNHYITQGVASPMVFLGSAYWTVEKTGVPIARRAGQGPRIRQVVAHHRRRGRGDRRGAHLRSRLNRTGTPPFGLAGNVRARPGSSVSSQL